MQDVTFGQTIYDQTHATKPKNRQWAKGQTIQQTNEMYSWPRIHDIVHIPTEQICYLLLCPLFSIFTGIYLFINYYCIHFL